MPGNSDHSLVNSMVIFLGFAWKMVKNHIPNGVLMVMKMNPMGSQSLKAPLCKQIQVSYSKTPLKAGFEPFFLTDLQRILEVLLLQIPYKFHHLEKMATG